MDIKIQTIRQKFQHLTKLEKRVAIWLILIVIISIYMLTPKYVAMEGANYDYYIPQEFVDNRTHLFSIMYSFAKFDEPKVFEESFLIENHHSEALSRTFDIHFIISANNNSNEIHTPSKNLANGIAARLFKDDFTYIGRVNNLYHYIEKVSVEYDTYYSYDPLNPPPSSTRTEQNTFYFYCGYTHSCDLRFVYDGMFMQVGIYRTSKQQVTPYNIELYMKEVYKIMEPWRRPK